MSATKVTLRKRELPSGKITLYLDFWPPVKNPRTGEQSRREYLGIYLVKKPKDATERRSNAEKLKIAEAIRSEREIAVLKEQFGFADHTRGKVDFIQYFQEIANEPGNYASGAFKHFFRFTGGKCTIADVTLELCQEFREYLLSGEASLDDKRCVSQNGASHLFMYFKMVLRRAQRDKLIQDDIASRLDPITINPVHKEYLTLDELKRLAAAPCKDEQLKRAGLLSCLCGLRISDIERLTWDNVIIAPDGGYALKVITKKTGSYAIIPISDEAFSLLGRRKAGPIFDRLSRNNMGRHIAKWTEAAGIDKHISFHNFRHTYATLLASSGVSIYTVSKLLTHSNVTTTQIYADIVDEDKRKAAESIKIGLTPGPNKT